jgi:hypothetical protein
MLHIQQVLNESSFGTVGPRTRTLLTPLLPYQEVNPSNIDEFVYTTFHAAESGSFRPARSNVHPPTKDVISGKFSHSPCYWAPNGLRELV